MPPQQHMGQQGPATGVRARFHGSCTVHIKRHCARRLLFSCRHDSLHQMGQIRSPTVKRLRADDVKGSAQFRHVSHAEGARPNGLGAFSLIEDEDLAWVERAGLHFPQRQQLAAARREGIIRQKGGIAPPQQNRIA